MDKSRIKTFFILLLLLVNAVFAGVYFHDLYSGAAAARADVSNIREAFANVGIEVKTEIPGDLRYSAVAVTYSRESEAAFAERALGESTAEDKGGGITYYTGKNGNALFSPGGVFEINLNAANPGSDSFEQQASKLAKTIGLTISELSADGNSLSCAITRNGLQVFNQSLSFEFLPDGAVTITGVCAVGTEQTAAASATFDAASAAMSFLHKIETDGVLCGEVMEIEQGYIFTDLEYKPAWRIVTDAGEFIISG
ncbi:MAG: hypothetical protein LBC38_00670 [Oscillospiraceae bacterium]|nr:hypothetical protein [Oscillospiraceae bacterium]